MSQRTGSYIEFLEHGTSASGKTKIWVVANVNNPTVPLGYVRWAGNWRKYVFEQEGSVYYDWQCLREIADFIEAATKEHRSK